MFENLISSNAHLSGTSRGSLKYAITACFLMISLLTGWVYSLFAKDMNLNGLSDQVQIVQTALAETKPPEPNVDPPRQTVTPTVGQILPDRPPFPTASSVPMGAPVAVPIPGDPGPTGTVIGGDTSGTAPAGSPVGNGTGTTPVASDPGPVTPVPEPSPVPEPEPTPVPRPSVIRSSGPLNGKALNLVQPGYPATARQMNIVGEVRVEIVIGENGRVLEARVTSGHPLLRPGIESAAKGSTFTPTMLNGQPIKVTGYIVYHFKR